MSKHLLLLAIILVALVVAAPLWAASSRHSSSPEVKVTRLEARVAALERRVKSLAVIDVRMNSQILNTQTRVFKLETKDTAVSAAEEPAIPVIVQPQTWGSANGGACGLGTLVGGGFRTDYPAEMGTSEPSSVGWSVHVFNPTSRPISLTADSVCVSVK